MCWKCGKQIIIQEPIPRDAECPFCHADIHSCKNCVFYEPGSHYDCHETVDELVVDKEHANFCDAFSLNKVSSKNGAVQNKAAEAKKSLEKLFGGE